MFEIECKDIALLKEAARIYFTILYVDVSFKFFDLRIFIGRMNNQIKIEYMYNIKNICCIIIHFEIRLCCGLLECEWVLKDTTKGIRQ